MPSRTDEQNMKIDLTVGKILTDQAIRLHKEGKTQQRDALLDVVAHGSSETLISIYDAIRADLREALQFAANELLESADKLWVSHCNHPGDSRIPQKDREHLYAQHAREDKERLANWSERAGNAAKEIKERLATT